MTKQSAIRHIVLIKLQPEASQEVLTHVKALLMSLGQQTVGLKEWIVVESLDSRKGRVVIENALFKNQEVFEQFRTSEEHARVGEYLKNVADWIVGDYNEDS